MLDIQRRDVTDYQTITPTNFGNTAATPPRCNETKTEVQQIPLEFPATVPLHLARRITVRSMSGYTPDMVRQYPENLFAFNDSALGYGHSGTSCIRDEPNAVGVVTDLLPNDTASTTLSLRHCSLIDRSFQQIIRTLLNGDYRCVVLPSDHLRQRSASALPADAHLRHRVSQLRAIFRDEPSLTPEVAVRDTREMPAWYSAALYDGDVYPYIKRKLGIHIAYDRGRHSANDFKDFLKANLTTIGQLVHKYDITSIQALDIFLCSNDRLLNDVSSDGPQIRKTQLSELDDVMVRRDTESAAAQSFLETQAAAAPVVSSWTVSRSVAGDDFSRLLNTTDVDLAWKLAERMTTGDRAGQIYLYSDMEGSAPQRRFASGPYSSMPVQVLRNNDSFIGVPIANPSGLLYRGTDVAHASGLWKDVFTNIRARSSKPTCDTVHFPEHMFGTQGLDGIDGFSELFSKLMGHVTRFTASAANSDHDVVQLHERGPNGLTDVMKPYHKYRKPVQAPYDSQVSGVPSDTAAALRRIQSDAKSMSLLTRTPSGRMLHGENSMLRTLTSCNSFSQLWLSDLLDAKERVRATVDVPTTHPHGLPWLRKQHPTLLAPIHPAGLQRYQAGPIVPIKLNNSAAVAMLDSGFTSNYNADFCIVQPTYCERLNIPIDTTKKHRVALADGTVSNTVGTATMYMRVGNRKPEQISMKVMHMPPGCSDGNADGFDILLGFTWMLSREMTLSHRRDALGHKTPGLLLPDDTLVPYKTTWDTSKSELQAFLIRSHEPDLGSTFLSPAAGDVTLRACAATCAPIVNEDIHGIEGGHDALVNSELTKAQEKYVTPPKRVHPVQANDDWTIQQLYQHDFDMRTDIGHRNYLQSCDPRYDPRWNEVLASHAVSTTYVDGLKSDSTSIDDNRHVRRLHKDAVNTLAYSWPRYDICDEDKLQYRRACVDAYNVRLLSSGSRLLATGPNAIQLGTSTTTTGWMRQITDLQSGLTENRSEHDDMKSEFYSMYCMTDSQKLNMLSDEDYLRQLHLNDTVKLDVSGQLAPNSHHRIVKTNHLRVPNSGGAITNRATLRRKQKELDTEKVRAYLRKQFETDAQADFNDDSPHFYKKEEEVQKTYSHGECWTPDEEIRCGDDIMDDLVFIGDDGDIKEGLSPVFLEQLRRMENFESPDAAVVGFETDQVHVSQYRDTPDLDRVESGLSTAPMAAHVRWALMEERREIENPRARLVTNIMKRDSSFSSTKDDQVNFIEFVRRVESGLLPGVADRELGKWCKSIAPPEVTDALTESCLIKMPVPIPQPDGSVKMEIMTVDAIAADIIDNENGRVLGKMREIFSDQDHTRQVKTTTPFKATLREDQKGKKPFFEFRRPAPALKCILEQWILDGLKKGHVQPWVSQYSSPVFCIRKPLKPGETVQRWRTLVDLRACNAALIPHRYPVPSTSEIFASLSPKFKVFSGFDACDGFFQVPVSSDTFKFLAFMSMPVTVKDKIITDVGGKREVIDPGTYSQFCFKVLPQGSQFSPSIFSEELVKSISRHVPEFGVNCFVFVDDICLATVDHESHLKLFLKLAKALYEDGWTLARTKTSFMKRSLKFLGLVISSVKVPDDEDDDEDADCKIWGDRSKIEVILNLQEPKTLKELRSVLGALGFYRVFVPCFGLTSKCLTNLTKKDADVAGDWTEECSVAFAKLKLDVATAAAITPYDTERQAILMIDSCKEGTAGVLSQSYGNRLRPVSFFSRAWTGSEQSASPQLSELKGLVSCCLHWKQFLWGQKVGISILSDHGSLKYLASARAQGTCSDKVERFAAFLGSLNAQVSWRAGASLLVADHLSRHGHTAQPLPVADLSKKEQKKLRSGTMKDAAAQREISSLYPSRYDNTATGMKDPKDLLQDVSWNVDDLGVFTDEEIDNHMVGGKNKLLSGFPMDEVVNTGCADENIVFKGTPIQEFIRFTKDEFDLWSQLPESSFSATSVQEFVRVTNGTFNTGTSDLGSDTIAAVQLHHDLNALFVDNNGLMKARNPNRTRESLCDHTLRTFKDLWMPAALDSLRDQMTYDGQERVIQRVLVEGLSDDEAEQLGVLHQKNQYGLNNRSELMVYDADIGWATVIPSGREDIFRGMVRWIHEHDHASSKDTFRIIRRRFWWNSLASMRKLVKEICQQCTTCSTQKSMRHTTYFQPRPIDVGSVPFQVISIDPKPMQMKSSQGHDSLLCVVDRFSGWMIAIPHYTTDDAEAIARLLDIHIYSVFGCPRLILSDDDTRFHSKVFQAVQRRRGVTVSLGTPYHGKTSGGVEIRIKVLQEHLRIRTNDQGSDWLEELPEALMAVNNIVNEETTLSPYMILLGYRPTSPIDMLREPVEDDKYGLLTDAERLEHYLQHRDDDRRDHVDRLRGDRERQETASQKKSAPPQNYKVGGWVILHRRAFGDQAKFNGRKLNKLERLEAYGPYRVLELTAKGRIKVELQREWSGQKTNEFSLQDVRWYYTRRPWDFDQISLEQHLEETWDANREYAVDHVVARKYNRRTYTYQVKFTGRTGDKSKFLAMDSIELEGCIDMLKQFDIDNPRGSLPNDSPRDKVAYNKTQRSARWAGRLRRLVGVQHGNDEMRRERRILRISEKYSVPVRASFADKVARRSPVGQVAVSEDEASGTKPVLRGGAFGT